MKRVISHSATTHAGIPYRFVRGDFENAQVVEALQDAVLFIMDGPVPPAENRSFRRHEMDDDDGDGDRGRLEVEPGSLVPFV